MDVFREAELEWQRKKVEERIGDKPSKPKRIQFIYDDATPEAIGEGLYQNHKGGFLLVDEISGLIGSFSKYHGGKDIGEKARLLSACDCQSWKTNRKTEGKDIFIPAACLGILGGLQPGMLSECFKDIDKESGFLQRFIIIRAERTSPALWSKEVISEHSISLLYGIDHLLTFDVLKQDDLSTIPYIVDVSNDAKQCYIE